MHEGDSRRLAPSGFNRPVNVRVPAEVVYDLEKAVTIQREILGRLGCLGCTSGFDIRFVLETEFLVDEKMNVLGGGLMRGG